MEPTIFEQLAAPFPPDRVSWRVGQVSKQDSTKGKALAYIDARDVMERLDEVCGPDGWQNDYPHANGKTVCRIGIRIEGEWIWKADGAGDSDIEAEKGALSDAFKRAAVRWGVGRYLYAIPSPWVELNQYKQITDESRTKLEGLLERFTTEFEWGTSAERATLKALANTVRNVVQTQDDVRRWREENMGVIALLRVKAREHLFDLLSRIEDGATAKAA